MMKSNSITADPIIFNNRTYSSTLNRSSVLNSNLKSKYNLKSIPHVSSTDDFIGAEVPKKSQQISYESRYTPTSVYDNYGANVTKELDGEKTRRSRQHDQYEKRHIFNHKEIPKRDLSMPPINCREQQHFDEIFCSKYAFGLSKYSIGDLETQNDVVDIGYNDIYDQVETSASITPPPVHMIHEYANRKAIIRPLAFRPVQSDKSQGVSDASPIISSASGDNQTSIAIKQSPPPIPPHAGRLPRKSSLCRVQSLKYGDSSGYYSSRTVCPTNGNISSSDISPTYDDIRPIRDNGATGEIYANTIDLLNDYKFNEESEQEPCIIHSSLESEITANKEHSHILEAALTNSNEKLIDAEALINELKTRLAQKAAEVKTSNENLILVKRSLEHYSQKSYNLEKSIHTLKSLKLQSNAEKVVKDKSTQTNLFNGDNVSNKLLEQFDDERRTWLDEKLKVLTYQKQIETNFQKLLIRYRHLESQMVKMKIQARECRSQHSHSTNMADDHEKSSLNSTDSNSRNYFTNISRIESTEHQLSF